MEYAELFRIILNTWSGRDNAFFCLLIAVIGGNLSIYVLLKNGLGFQVFNAGNDHMARYSD